MGRSIVTRLAELAESIETVRRLQSGLVGAGSGAPATVPPALAGSELTLSTSADPAAPTRRLIDLVGGASRVGLLAPALVPDVLPRGEGARLRRQDVSIEAAGTIESDVVVEIVVPRDALGSMPSDDGGTPGRRPHRSGTFCETRVYAYDGEVPTIAGFADGTAFLADVDADRTVRGCIETGDDALRSKIEERFEAYRRDAEPVLAGVLTP